MSRDRVDLASPPAVLVEAVAKSIDPSAWGLADNTAPASVTPRDIARDRARAVLALLGLNVQRPDPPMPRLPPGYDP